MRIFIVTNIWKCLSFPGNGLNLTNEKYIDALIPKVQSDQSLEEVLPTSVISMAQLKLMSLSDQIKAILKDGTTLNSIDKYFIIFLNFIAKVVQFDKLMQLLNNETLEKEKVLRTLPSVGILVQGNWILLSELLYPVDSVSGINGVPAEHMCRARDYIVGLSNAFYTSF